MTDCSLNPQMKQDFQRNIFHLAWSPDSLPATEAVRPLLLHLTGALSVYSDALLKKNMQRLLHLVWQAVLSALLYQFTKDSEASWTVALIRACVCFCM